jgi:hypothetical protein
VGGTALDPSADPVVRVQVRRAQADERPGPARVEPHPGKDVDLAPGSAEALADVASGARADHAVGCVDRPEDRELVAVVGHDLGVDTRPGGAQRTDELVHDAVPFELATPQSTGESGAEVEGVRRPASLDHQPSVSHSLASTARRGDCESKGPRLATYAGRRLVVGLGVVGEPWHH